jgi:hypothetical protein
MRTPVVVASTWSASQAELLAQHLRARGIESFTKTNLDRVAYGGELGGAKVFVDADQRLEAELEIVLLHEDDDSDEPRSGAAAPPFATRRRWVRVAGWIALAAMATGAVGPPGRSLWQALAQ